MILGIDPGKLGGLAWISDSNVMAVKMPATTEDVCAAIRSCGSIKRAWLEKVHAMPKQGVKSTFTFGQGFGEIRGILTALRITFSMVTPRVWQTSLACLTKGNKNVTKARAQELFPMIDTITHATADALLIAEYGRRQR